MHSLVEKLARLTALLGGVVLVLLILLICASVIGRSLNGVLHSDAIQSFMPAMAEWLLALGIGPINGDFEIVEAGMAFAIFAFIPICQLHGAHAYVDVFTSGLPPKAKRLLQAIIDTVFAAVLILFAWQMYSATLSKMRSGQTTLLIEFPVWWSYTASTVAAVIVAFVAVYVAVIRLQELFSGQSGLLPQEGAEH